MCSETCVGRIRYLGVVLYDADRIEEAASEPDEQDLYEAQLDIFLDPNDPAVIAAGAAPTACRDAWLEAAQGARRSGRWRWNGRSRSRCTRNTARCRWSGTCRRCRRSTSAAAAGKIGLDGEMPDVQSLRIPMKYLANLLTAGDEKPVTLALERMLAMRAYMRAKTIDGVVDEVIARRVGLTARADRGDVPHHGDRQLRGPLRHSDRAPRTRRGRLRPARLLRLHLRQWLLRRRKRNQPVRLAKRKAKNPMEIA